MTLQRFMDGFGWSEVIQLLVLAVALFFLMRRLAGVRALRLLILMIGVGIVDVLAGVLHFEIIRIGLERALQYGVIAAIVIFQPELRNAVTRLGRNRVVRFITQLEENEIVEEISEAVERLARAKLGAIFVLERQAGLEEYIETGTRLQARVSADLLVSLFLPYAPLHDGAALIAGDTIIAAGVILPLTQQPIADKSLGTRHRAALGLSEETDAIVIVVSEETQQISIATRGRLERNVDTDRLQEVLTTAVAETAVSVSAQ